MLQIAVCDDNIDELFNMVQLINLYRTTKDFSCQCLAFSNGVELVSALEKEKLFLAFDEMLEQIKVRKDEDAFVVKSNEGIQKILISNLVFAEVIGRNVLYHLCSFGSVTIF